MLAHHAPRVAAIVLAAGKSRRLGQPKQLVLLDGEPLLRRICRLALEANCSPVVVVLGAEVVRSGAVLTGLRPSLRCVVNPNWMDGMSTSLRTGIAELEAPTGAGEGTHSSESVLVLVCDQVRLTLPSLQRLIDTHERSTLPATAARYSGRLGVPAIFRTELLPALAALTGDQGARQLLEAWADRTAAVDMPEAAFELDTPEDLGRLLPTAPDRET